MPISRVMKLSNSVSLGVMLTLSSTVTTETQRQHRQGISAIAEMVVEPTRPKKGIQIL